MDNYWHHSLECDSDVFKVECDASFVKTSEKGGDAAVAFSIWKNARLIEVQAMRDLECNSSQHAEGVSILNTLNRGTDFGIKKLVLITDNEENCDITMGSRSVFDSKDPDTSIAFIEAAKKYDICKCRKEPREMIRHIDALAKAAFKADPYDLDRILEQKSYRFWGLPFVEIIQNQVKI